MRKFDSRGVRLEDFVQVADGFVPNIRETPRIGISNLVDVCKCNKPDMIKTSFDGCIQHGTKVYTWEKGVCVDCLVKLVRKLTQPAQPKGLRALFTRLDTYLIGLFVGIALTIITQLLLS